MIKKCAVCGKEFETRFSWQVTCSPACRKKWRYANCRAYYYRHRDPLHERKCVRCGKTFQPVHGAQKYCSPECAKSQPKKPIKPVIEPKKGFGQGTCFACGRQFERTFTNERFCSDDCRVSYFHRDVRYALAKFFKVR